MAAPERPIYIEVLKTKGLTADGVFTANAGIVATTLTTSGLLTANAGLTVVSGLATLYGLVISNGTTNYAPLCVTTSGAIASLASAGTAGQVLVANTGALPSFQAIRVRGISSFCDYDTYGGSINGFTGLALLDTDGRVRVHGHHGLVGTKFGVDVPIYVSSMNFGVKKLATKVWLFPNNIFVLLSDSTVWSLGYNNEGEMGNGNATVWNTPKQVNTLTGVTRIVGSGDAISSRSYYAYTIGSPNFYSWGYNDSFAYGILGLGVTGPSRTSPVLKSFAANGNVVQAIMAGGWDTFSSPCTGCVLLSDGTVWMCGYGAWWQMGQNPGITTAINATWLQVKRANGVNMDEVTQITSAGYDYFTTFYALRQGVVWVWGYNEAGEAGIDPGIAPWRIEIPTVMPGTSGITKMWGTNASGRQCFYCWNGATSTLSSCGFNVHGQCGRNNGGTCPTLGAVALGGNTFDDLRHSGCGNGPTVYIIVNNYTDIMVTGYNLEGQCGVGTTTNLLAFTKIPTYWPYKIRDVHASHHTGSGGNVLVSDVKNRLYGCGWNYYGRMEDTNNTNCLWMREITNRLLM